MSTEITTAQNGPYVIEGAITINDFDGSAIEVSEVSEGVVALCRCGRSANKPFCDGSHVDPGFDGTSNPSNRAG